MKTARTSGFTLIEVVCSLLLTGVLAASAMALTAYVVRGFETVRQQAALAANLELAMGRLVRESRAADSISTAGGGITFTRDGVDRVFSLAGGDLVVTMDENVFPLMRQVAVFSAQVTDTGASDLLTFAITPDGDAPVFSTQICIPND